jgi:hypothetical protein
VSFSVTADDLCAGTASVESSPASGSVFLIGTTTVTNIATDASGNTSECTFTVTVVLNTAPVAGDDNMGAIANHSRSIWLEKLLDNDYDPDGDDLSIIAVSANSTNGGTVVLTSTNVIYTPATDFTGTDRFTYTVGDGRGGIAVATVVVTVGSADDLTPNIMSITMTETNTVKIRFAGIPGFTYGIERTANLSPASWGNIGTICVPANGIAEFEDLTPPQGMAYYRTAYTLAP